MTEEFKCLRCGWCCQHLVYDYKRNRVVPAETLAWMKVRGIALKGNKLIIPSDCKYLTWTFEEDTPIAVCECQDAKPLICRKMKCDKEAVMA